MYENTTDNRDWDLCHSCVPALVSCQWAKPVPMPWCLWVKGSIPKHRLWKEVSLRLLSSETLGEDARFGFQGWRPASLSQEKNLRSPLPNFFHSFLLLLKIEFSHFLYPDYGFSSLSPSQFLPHLTFHPYPLPFCLLVSKNRLLRDDNKM